MMYADDLVHSVITKTSAVRGIYSVSYAVTLLPTGSPLDVSGKQFPAHVAVTECLKERKKERKKDGKKERKKERNHPCTTIW